MYTDNPNYSLQESGSNTRLLRTVGARTAVVTTAPTPLIEGIAGELALMRNFGMLIHAAARDADGGICYLRRRVLATLDGSQPSPDDIDAANGIFVGLTPTPEQFAAPLAAKLADAPDPVRRAVRDEVGYLLDGTEDVLVLVTIESETGSYTQWVLLNGWLEQASDDAIVVAFEDWVDTYLGTILEYLTDRDDELYELWARETLDVTVDLEHIRKWVERHRPALLARIADSTR